MNKEWNDAIFICFLCKSTCISSIAFISCSPAVHYLIMESYFKIQNTQEGECWISTPPHIKIRHHLV